MMSKVILVIEDQEDNRRIMHDLLTSKGYEVIEAVNGFDGVNAAETHRPDLILMDIRMPRCDGLAATRLIKAESPEAKIVILTSSLEEEDLFDAIRSGACGYLLKSMDADELIVCLEQAQQGIPPFSPGLASRLLEEFARLAKPSTAAGDAGQVETQRQEMGEKLTPRQRQVLALVAQGLSYKEVGAKLGLGPRTIKYHMAEIMEQLHLEHRSQVLAYAGRMGLGCESPDA
jgi:two-component system NarL family response regulator